MVTDFWYLDPGRSKFRRNPSLRQLLLHLEEVYQFKIMSEKSDLKNVPVTFISLIIEVLCGYTSVFYQVGIFGLHFDIFYVTKGGILKITYKCVLYIIKYKSIWSYVSSCLNPSSQNANTDMWGRRLPQPKEVITWCIHTSDHWENRNLSSHRLFIQWIVTFTISRWILIILQLKCLFVIGTHGACWLSCLPVHLSSVASNINGMGHWALNDSHLQP